MSTDATPASSEDASSSAPTPDTGKPEESHRGAESGNKDGGRAIDDDSNFRESASSSAKEGFGSYHRPRQFQADVFLEGRENQVNIGNTYYYPPRVAPPPPPGPVPTELLETVRERYVKVTDHPNLVTALRKRRLLMLGGAPATGRTFTALHLLDKLARGKVMRLDVKADLCALSKDELKSGSGYLDELTESDAVISVNQADRLDALLRQCDCYLVVVVTGDHMRTSAFAIYGLKCPPPDAKKLLDQHITAQLSPADPEDLKDKLTALADSQSLQTALGPNPSVGETGKFAQLLLAYGRNEIPLQQVESDCSGFVKDQVIEWFSALPRTTRYDVAEQAMRVAGFQLALAVLNEMPRTVVTDAAEDLAGHLIRTAYPQRTPGRPLFADPDITLLDLIRGSTGQRPVYYSSAPVAVDVIGFQDDRYPQTVLSHVWRQHHNLRPPLIRWLHDLAQHPESYVRECAAEAAGVLCWVDFPGASDQLIWPAAGTEPPEGQAERSAWWDYLTFAALALDQASQNERLYTVVEGILKSWRRKGTHSQRCTAAIAHGYPPVHRSIETSLEELRIIGTPQELEKRTPPDETTRNSQNQNHYDLIWAAGRSIALLFATGAQDAILARLSHWIERREYPEERGHPPRESLQRLALQTVILMADLKVAQLSERQFSGTRTDRLPFPKDFEKRRKWPLLLALLDDNPSLANPISSLLRRTLRSAARKIALKKLDSWMRTAQADPACADVLVCLLPNLVESESDRARLLDCVHYRRIAWVDALRSDFAEQLVAALEYAPNGKRKYG